MSSNSSWGSKANYTIAEIVKVIEQGKERFDWPLVSVSHRVKSTQSIYYKLKRLKPDTKSNMLDCIDDYGGVRVVCLCEYDIFSLNKLIIDNLPNNVILGEVVFFNFTSLEDSAYVSKFGGWIHSEFTAVKITRRTTSTDHRYINLVLQQENPKVELQIRTMAQHLAAEAESELINNKFGRKNKRITRDFGSVSEQLKAVDKLLCNITDARDHEEIVLKEYRSAPLLSRQVFIHEADFLSNAKNYIHYGPYISLLKDRLNEKYKDTDTWYHDGYNAFRQLTAEADLNDDESLYWKEVENAYWECFRGADGIENALQIYHGLVSRFEDRTSEKIKKSEFLLFFRIGEIHFIKGDYLQAFREFDRCEDLIKKIKSEQELQENISKALSNIAYFYWRLSQQYCSKALALSKEARDCLVKNDLVGHIKLANAVTWYALEIFMQEGNPAEEKFLELNEHFTELNKQLNMCLASGIEIASNAYHTLAVSAFELHKYYANEGKQKEADEFLDKAVEFCDKCRAQTNIAYHLEFSTSLHRQSLQEILLYCNRRKLMN